MRNILYMIGGSLCLLLFMTGCKSADGAKAPVSLTWEMGAAEVQPDYYELIYPEEYIRCSFGKGLDHLLFAVAS